MADRAGCKTFVTALALFLLPFEAAAYCDTCPRDASGRIQRSAAARVEFKREHPCPATLQSRGPCTGYVIDHIIPLKRGGPDLPSNMQWQTVAEARAKDRWE